MSFNKLFRMILFPLLMMACSSTLADVVRVAVASNFSLPMREIVKQFQQETGHRVQLSSGSSGKFYAQIMNGAPYDIFLSADTVKPEKLEQANRIVSGSRFTYAMGTLVLWSSNDEIEITGPEVITAANIRKLAIANPRLAPYGAAAREVLSKLKLWPSIKAQLVMGENISQTFQFVDTGNAQLGLIALSQINRDDTRLTGKQWIVPQEFHAPIKQQAVLLLKKVSEQNPVASQLMNYLQSSRSRQIIEGFGYVVPSG